ncbi:MAG: outer membrane lipoprotein carrier protein LolA [Burkholderiaceae bacterium]
MTHLKSTNQTPQPEYSVAKVNTPNMQTGAMRRHVVLTFLLIGLSVPGLALSEGMTISDVFRQLAASPITTAPFVEQRHVVELDETIRTRGELEFVPPSLLVKRTLTSPAETMILDGDTLIFEQFEVKREMLITDLPGVGAFAASLRGFVSGRLDEVESVFTLTLTSHVSQAGKESAWVIRGTPKSDDVAKIVNRIEVSGDGPRLKVVEIKFRNGDHSTLTLVQ